MTATGPLTGTAPLVAVRDVVASIAFYQDCLGFDALDEGDRYGLVRRDNLLVGFVKAGDEQALHATANNVSAQFWVDDVETIWDEIKTNFSDWPELAPTGPIVRDYGLRELHVKDPDGFLMFFTDKNISQKGA